MALRFHSFERLHFAGLVLLLAACGGRVVIDDGWAGAGGTTSTGPVTNTTSTTSSGPNIACSQHADCPGGLCVFTTGTCAPACTGSSCDSCSPGTICDLCGTSSCVGCEDCLPVCVPKQPWQCDDNDPCPAGEVCIFQIQACAPACTTDAQCGGFAFCADCVTGSCCGCENCVSACVGGE